MASINWNTKDFESGMERLGRLIQEASHKALTTIAMEVLRLSQFEVPHDKGMLQASGNVSQDITDHDTVLVGYNKVYAARLHEHPEYNFQKGRKGKYLEDPIKHNLDVFRRFYAEAMKGVIK